MKHSSSRELFAYWDRRRGARAAPERGDIEPGLIRKALGDVFILGLDTGSQPSFRLAGTRVCALFGRELKGEAFAAVWEESHGSSIRDLLAIVATESVGVVAGARGRTAEGFSADLELLLLPLRHRAQSHRRMMGVLAPLAVPFWLGSSRLEPVALGSLRHLGPAIETGAAPGLAATSRDRVRRGLVVLDGGRS